MKKTAKPTPITITPKRVALRPSQLDGVVGGNGRNESHTAAPSQNLSHRVSPT